MFLKKIAHIVLIMSVATGVLSCSATAPEIKTSTAANTTNANPADLPTRYAELEKTGGKLFTLDPKSSTVRIFAFRGGKAARLGHNHVLSAPTFTGFFHLPVEGTTNAQFDLEFRLDQLEIDNPAYRATLGAAFATVVSPESIAGTREHMLGENSLQADRFPFVRIHSLQISGEAPKFAAEVRVEMHGQSRNMWIPLNVEGLPDRLLVSGSFVLRLTDFGVQPYSIMGGLLAVKDEVVIEFQLVGA